MGVRSTALLALVVAASPAWGQPAAITVEQGAQADAWVGNANGWFCDDPSLVRATMVTERDLNHWIVEGVRAGQTVCRVGTDPSRASFVFVVTVTEPTPKSAR